MTTIPESALKAGVLDASRHARLMLDMPAAHEPVVA